MTVTQKSIIGGVVAFFVLAATAIGASYFTRSSMVPEQTAQPVVIEKTRVVHHSAPQQQQQAAAVRQGCNDHNIVGTGLGAVAGGVLGNQFGKGTGKTVATVGGAAGGAYLGNEYIPTRGATCN